MILNKNKNFSIFFLNLKDINKFELLYKIKFFILKKITIFIKILKLIFVFINYNILYNFFIFTT